MPPVADTFSDIRQDVLDRAGEDPADTAGDFYATAGRQIVRGYHELCNAHPYLFLRATPPGALRTVGPITAGTILVTNGSTSITFSSAPTVSVQARELLVTGWREAYRIATHTAGATAATLDSEFNGTTAAAANYRVIQREYDLASDVRHIVAMLVAEDGWEILQRDEPWLRTTYPDPPEAVWPPKYFSRIGERRIRFEGYPDRTRRLEYPYTIIPPDIDGAGVTIHVPRNWRYVINDHGLYWVYIVKNDSRADAAGILAANGREKMIEDDLRKRMPLAGVVTRGPGPYA